MKTLGDFLAGESNKIAQSNRLIEVIADLIEERKGKNDPRVVTLLVPEQCMEIAFNGKYYHLTVEEIDEG
jgi:hypothetical protein